MLMVTLQVSLKLDDISSKIKKIKNLKPVLGSNVSNTILQITCKQKMYMQQVNKLRVVINQTFTFVCHVSAYMT